MENNSTAFTIAENHYGIQKLLKPSEMDKPDRLALFTYLSNFYAVFKELELPEKPVVVTPPKKTPPSKPPRRNSQLRSPHYQKILMTPPSTERSWNTRASTSRRVFRSSKKEKKKEKETNKETKKDIVRTESVPQVAKPSIKKLGTSSDDVKKTTAKSKSDSNVLTASTTSSTKLTPATAEVRNNKPKV